MQAFSYRCLKVVFLMASLLAMGKPSMALIDAEALVGRETGTLSGHEIGSNDIKLSGTVAKAAVHLDPIPLIPIGFGLGITMPKVEGKDSSHNTLQASGLLVDLEVMAWTPISLFGIKPYAKLGYTVFGTYKVDQTIKNAVTMGGTTIDPLTGELASSYTLQPSGYQMAIGARYSLLPLISLLFEVAMRQETLKAKDVKVASQELGLGESKLAATNIMLGLEVGL